MYDDSLSTFEELAAPDNETWRSIAATKAKPAAEPALTATSFTNIVSQTDGNANEKITSGGLFCCHVSVTRSLNFPKSRHGFLLVADSDDCL